VLEVLLLEEFLAELEVILQALPIQALEDDLLLD